MREYLQQFEFYNQEQEFFYGLAIAAIILMLARFVGWILSARKCQGIMIPGEHGNLFVTTTAIEDFIIRTLADIDDMLIDRVRLRKKGSRYAVVVTMRVASDSNVNELRPQIEQRILNNTKSKIGVDSITEVNILLKNFSAKESQISKRHKLAMKEFSSVEEPVIEASTSES